MIRTCKLTVDGASGTDTSKYPFSGEVYAVYIDYSASADSGTDVTVATGGTNYPATTIYTKSNSNTDAAVYPRVALHDTAGAAINYATSQPIYGHIPVNDYLVLTVAQNAAGQSVTAYVLIEC